MIPDTNGYDADLFDAVEYGEIEWIRDLLEPRTTWPVNINAQDMTGQTVLMLACFHGRGDVVDVLLERGADPNMQDLAGKTALTYAQEPGHPTIIEALKRAGAIR